MNMAREKLTVLPGGKGKGASGSGGGEADAGDWRDDLTRNREGKIEATTHNITLILANDPSLDGLFYLDEFANRVALTREGPWPGGNKDEFTDIDGTELSAWCGSPHHYRVSPKPDAVMSCVEAVSRRRARHPVREYLRGLKWDGVKRVESMFAVLFGSEDSTYTRKAALCFMVSAVARILWVDPLARHNGAQVDFMLILEGEQGVRKTSAVRTLFSAAWYMEAMESPAGKDFYQSLRGRWCVEIGEMDSFNKSDVTKVKQAITSRFDTYRPSYGRVSRSFRRECVFVGTTNESEYLRDSTGARRFLPIRVSSVHIAKIEDQRDQLWAEAVALFGDGYPWWDLPAQAVDEQEARFTADSWEEIIAPWVDGRADAKHYPERIRSESSLKPEWVTTSEVLIWAIGADVAKHTKQDQMRIAPIMRRIGWRHDRPWINGKRERRWVRVSEPGGDDDVPF
jgi:predicted P-loop ATPase